MPILDTFSRQLVAMVRSMPDDALLQLVVHGLATPNHATQPKKATLPATSSAGAARQPVKRPQRKRARPTTASAPAAAKPVAKPAGKAPSSARLSKDALTAAVEKVIRSSNGLGLGQVAAAVGQPKPAVSNVIRELKERRRIHLGGDRRFARYAGDAKTAKAASLRARAGK